MKVPAYPQLVLGNVVPGNGEVVRGIKPPIPVEFAFHQFRNHRMLILSTFMKRNHHTWAPAIPHNIM